jgi:hydroxyacid-oxoacid transhydrogenase
MANDIAFEMAVSSIRFGKGVTREIGMDLAELGVKRALVMTDRTLRALPPVHTALDSLDASKIGYAV